MANLQKASNQQINTSIVIATYGRPGGALSVIKQIRKYDSQIEIVVVDQKRTSQISEQDITQFNIKFINLDVPNLSAARNVGWKSAIGDWILFLDDDVEITEQTISEHSKHLQNSDVVGVVGRVINDNDQLPKELSVSTGQSNYLKLKFRYNFWSTKSQEVDFLYGCNMSCRRSILEKISGFDEYFQKIFDDVDIGFRLKRYGRLVFEPEALVYHHQATQGGSRYQKQQPENDLYRYYGYFIAKSLIFPISLISLFLRCRSAIFKGRSELLSLLRGYWDFYLRND